MLNWDMVFYALRIALDRASPPALRAGPLLRRGTAARSRAMRVPVAGFFMLALSCWACLSQPCGAKDAEAEVDEAVRRRVVVAIRRPAVARRAVPTPAPSHAGRARRSRDGLRRGRRVDVHRAAVRVDVVRIPVETPFPHSAANVAEAPVSRRRRPLRRGRTRRG